MNCCVEMFKFDCLLKRCSSEETAWINSQRIEIEAYAEKRTTLNLKICAEVYLIISASALIAPVVVILTFRWSPDLASPTKIKKPLILAIPSPSGLISVISTSYSCPNSTGQDSTPLPRLFLAFLGLLFDGLIWHLPLYTLVLIIITAKGLSVPYLTPRMGQIYWVFLQKR
jgi:hypothetical protein